MDFVIPEGFATVEVGIYRSSPLNNTHSKYIQSLNLKTCVSLSMDAIAKNFVSFFEENKIQLINISRESWKANHDWKPVMEELIKDSLEIILKDSSHPVLIVSSSSDVSVVIACLRKMLNWNFSSIIIEYRFFTKVKNRNREEQFIEQFDTDLVTVIEKSTLMERYS
ncbi:protein-tyrosine phosphatase [Rozella allomycis CSF55]|uniref:Protein-tyrosine phosphatase n=1 Tax=Rozella allomycis (strain CSF55) TaxID=988480 RepID=A0A075B463_ROZAC|nr:Protein-tyrosine phosphatase, SIW14-like domain-containing protein [Rozella allomycis CSF55]RKP19782.1 protein-tyrosine phosphatase [Rozella allomycis CSF55]|eukprot:EPZ35904.1 Protein-tyrosine phosphatase, SIW14-like domain-containing protein [Rozella allomycis CSF55]